MRIIAAPTFLRAVKKLHREHKAGLDEAVRLIAENPQTGEAKIGDLAGVRVIKFRLNAQLCLLAYTLVDDATIELLALGSHENFHRDLKR